MVEESVWRHEQSGTQQGAKLCVVYTFWMVGFMVL